MVLFVENCTLFYIVSSLIRGLMSSIIKAVGNRAPNIKFDVQVIQRLLNKCLILIGPYLPLAEDGDCGPITIGVILEFQKRFVAIGTADGRIDPGKKTFLTLLDVVKTNSGSMAVKAKVCNHNLLNVQSYLKSFAAVQEKAASKQSELSSKSKTLSEQDFKNAAILLGVKVAAIKAVASVESAGGGFFADGKPKILFEGHWFSKLTKGQHDQKYPSISYPKWTKKHYIGGSKEYNRYSIAERLDKEAAQKWTSWGKFQIMGFNHKKSGYSTVDSFVKDMHVSEGKQLNAFVQFLKSTHLDVHLKSLDWAKFAHGYNGPKYADNKYDVRLKQAYEAFSAGV